MSLMAFVLVAVVASFVHHGFPQFQETCELMLNLVEDLKVDLDQGII